MGRSQQETAVASGLALGTISRAERTGAISVPSLVKLAKAFGIAIGTLLDDGTAPEAASAQKPFGKP